NRSDAREESDRVELDDVQRAELVGERDGAQREEPQDVSRDQDRSPPQPVDPHPGGEADQDERQEFQSAEQAHLERVRPEDHDGRERERQERDLRPELSDGLAGPKPYEIAVPPEAPWGLRTGWCLDGFANESRPSMKASSQLVASGMNSRRNV